MLKKISVLFLLSVILCAGMDAPCADTHRTATDKAKAMRALTKIARAFDMHAKAMGGAGTFYGIKSKIISLFHDEHREALVYYTLRAPKYMLIGSGIADRSPNIGKLFVAYCRMMPTAYDTYSSCRDKILRCVKIVYPDRDEIFYKNAMNRIRNKSGARWI